MGTSFLACLKTSSAILRFHAGRGMHGMTASSPCMHITYQTHKHTHSYTRSHAHTHTHKHTHAYAHTHTRSYIHTHTWISSSHRCLCATSITSSACAARMATMRAPTSAASFTRCWMAAAGRSLKSAPPKPPGLCNVHKQVNSPRSKGPRSRAAGWQLQGAR